MPITQYNSSVRQMSQSKFNSMKNASGKIPDLANQIVMTNSEDTNTSYLRTEVVYDMTSSDANINWGYTSGIQGNNTAVGGKDFSRYSALIITAKQGVASMTSIMDLTTINTQSNTYNSGALGCEAVDTDYCKFTVNANKTEFTCNRIGYRNSTGQAYDVNDSSAICIKIIGVLKEPSMIYTGDELIAGNGISIANGVISADSNLFFFGEVGTASPTYTITKDFTNGIYDIICYGTVTEGLDFFILPNNNTKTVYGNAWTSYDNTAPAGSEASSTGFNVGTAGTNYSIFHITMTVSDGLVIVESNSICVFSGTTYRRNNMRYGSDYGNIKSLVFSTNSAGNMNTGFRFYVYRRAYN